MQTLCPHHVYGISIRFALLILLTAEVFQVSSRPSELQQPNMSDVRKNDGFLNSMATVTLKPLVSFRVKRSAHRRRHHHSWRQRRHQQQHAHRPHRPRASQRLLQIFGLNNRHRLRPLTSPTWDIHQWATRSQNQRNFRRPLQTLTRGNHNSRS